ncbi:MAG: nucleotidyltransferase family protein [Chloroflexia bacterium]
MLEAAEPTGGVNAQTRTRIALRNASQPQPLAGHHAPYYLKRSSIRVLMLLTGARVAKEQAISAALGTLDPEERQALFSVILAEGLAPTVETHLRSRRLSSLLHESEREMLQAEHSLNTVAFFQQVHALSRIAAAFAEHGIDFRLLKGLALAAQAYPYPTARRVGDMDIWVKPRDLLRALQVLNQLGMRTAEHGPTLSAFVAAYAKEVVLYSTAEAGFASIVDLHWHPAAPWWMRATLSIDEAALFNRSYVVEIASLKCRTLDPTDNMWYLSLHAGVGHRYEGMRWLVDLALLARSGTIDWRRLNGMVARSGTVATTWRAVEMLDRACGSNYASLLKSQPRVWHRAALRVLLPGFPSRRDASPEVQPDVALPLDRLVLLPGLPAMVGALRRLLWPSGRWVRLRYPQMGRKSILRARLHHLTRLRHLVARRRR